MRNVMILFGGKSPEHDISIITAVHAINDIDRNDYRVYPVYIRESDWLYGEFEEVRLFRNFNKNLYTKVWLDGTALFTRGILGRVKKLADIDCALLCNHGGDGENGNLQGLLEMNNVPYTSAGVTASAICMDKVLCKAAAERAGVNIVPFKVIDKDDYLKRGGRLAAEISKELSYPLIIKPARTGSSIGITVVHNKAELMNAIGIATAYDSKILIEKVITDKTEINCAAVSSSDEVFVSCCERPYSSNEILTFMDKYQKNGKSSYERELPAKIDPELSKLIRETTGKLYNELELFGVVRIDFLYDNAEKKLYMNEINTIPGSLAFHLFEECGMSFPRLIDILINAAIERKDKESRDLTEFNSKVLYSIFNTPK